MKFNKDIPIFLRFLKLVCDQEKRPKDFIDFAKRYVFYFFYFMLSCENGLVVQEGAYISKAELLANMDKNGYSNSEIAAFSLAFPDDYKFHYPELAAAFDLSEEDAFKFAMRTRMENQEISHVKYDKTPGFVTTFIATYLPIAALLANPYSVSNYALAGKILPYYLSIYALYRSFGSDLLNQYKQINSEIAKQNSKVKLEGQEALMMKTAKFAEDTNAVAYLQDLKPATEKKFAAYRAALIADHKRRVTERVERQLNSLRNAEREVATGLQELMAREIMGAFRNTYSDKMAASAFESAVANIAGEDSTTDPVKDFVLKALAEFQAVDLSKVSGKATGTVVERVAFAYQQREKNLLNNFTVRAEEAKKIAEIAKSCNGDASKLSAAQLDELDKIFRELHERVGFATLTEKQVTPLAVPAALEGDAAALVAQTKKAVDDAATKIRVARLQSFLGKF